MTIRLGLVGDTMLGRGVAEQLRTRPDRALFDEEVVAAAADADVLIANLECCISERGRPWPDPHKPFFFRAPPVAAERLAEFGVKVVTLANNHALDYGREALDDTFEHLSRVGIQWVGAGRNLDEAQRPLVLDVAGMRVGVVAFSDHPAEYAATPDLPGIAYIDLRRGLAEWLPGAVAAADADVAVITPHWGPNMSPRPIPHVRAAVPALVGAGATVVAGHSAHIFQGCQRLHGSLVLYDLGDFIDDYAVDPVLRNDLGLLWLVDVDDAGPSRVEAVPLALEFGFTRIARDAEADWIARRLTQACAAFGQTVEQRAGRLVLDR